MRTYSHGMSQRLAIAQAMLGLPDLLVLDEPMNGLDPPQIREMRDVLVRYAADGRAVILSSHMLAEVEQTCTHVVVMGMGRRLAGRAGSARSSAPERESWSGTPQAQRAVTVLAGLHGIDSAEPHPDGILVHPNGVAASAVVAALVGAGIPVDRVTPNRRLEDAFLALIAGSDLATRRRARTAAMDSRPHPASAGAPGYRARAGPCRSGWRPSASSRRRRTMIAFWNPAGSAVDPGRRLRGQRPGLGRERDARAWSRWPPTAG